MKYQRITERRDAPLTMSMWAGDSKSLKVYNRLAELEDKIEDGELISTGQDEQSEQEIKFFAKHDVKVCKEVVKECLQVLRDMRMVCIGGYYLLGWNDCIDEAIEQLTERYCIDTEVFRECTGSVHGDPVGAPGADGEPAIKNIHETFSRPSSAYNKERTMPRGKVREHRRQKR